MPPDVEAVASPTAGVRLDATVATLRTRDSGSRENFIEAASEYPSGYPLYSFHLGLRKDFKNFRRFKTVRMRLLLLKQHKLSNLERQLKSADNDEVAELRLGCLEHDNNEERQSILRDLDIALKDYDDLLQRTNWLLAMKAPLKRRIREQKAIVGPDISREETAYLDAGWEDLINIDVQESSSMTRLLPFVDDVLFRLYMRLFFKTKTSQSGAGNLVHFSRPGTRSIVRALVAIFTVLVLLVPVVILNFVTSTQAKFAVIFVAASTFVGGITMFSGASLAEIFAGGATYSAVLVVFVSQGGVSDTQ